MSRRLYSFLLFLFISNLEAGVQLLPPLPNAAAPAAMQVDSSGAIYVAGSYVPSNKTVPSAFVAKLAAGGSQVIYFTSIGGSFNDLATGLAVAPDGSVFAAGNTNSFDFPVTAGALDIVFKGQTQGFLAKFDPTGKLTYATYIQGPVLTQVTGITLDAAGDIYLTGFGGPKSPSSIDQPLAGFVLEVDAALAHTPLSVYGYGGGLIALDAQSNIYLAGSAMATFTQGSSGLTPTLPAFPAGAFQSTHAAAVCYSFASGPGGVGGEQACPYQFAAKLNQQGTLLWGTYVTGTYGATAYGMAVDSAGNVILAGTTSSDDYPVTSGAFQTSYAAGAPPLPPGPQNVIVPPPSTGFITKVNNTGTGLVWSTFFGGSFTEQVTGMAVDANGDIVIGGVSGSSDLPGIAANATMCHPSPNQMLRFVSVVAADGSLAGHTQLVAGQPFCTYFACTDYLYDGQLYMVPVSPLTLENNGDVLIAGGDGSLASVDFTTGSRISCVVDPADFVQVHSVAPGQLLTIFGTDLAPAFPFIPTGGVTGSTASFGVTFNGIAAPILYSSASQINIQVPYEIAGQTSVEMQLVDQQTALPVSETVNLAVEAQEASIFLTPVTEASQYPGNTLCGGSLQLGASALAINADGTVNDCSNPAPAGSTVTLFVNGMGAVTPVLTTGTISPAPAVTLSPAVSLADSTLNPVPVQTLTLPGAIDSVAQVRVQLPNPLPSSGAYDLVPSLSGSVMRERLVLIWVRAD